MNTNANNAITRNSTRRCSFCRLSGHDIRTCNDNRLLQFEYLCDEKMIYFKQNNNDPYLLFRNWLLDEMLQSRENKKIIQAYSIKIGCTRRTYILDCIVKIVNYFSIKYDCQINNLHTELNDDDLNTVQVYELFLLFLSSLQNNLNENHMDQEVQNRKFDIKIYVKNDKKLNNQLIDETMIDDCSICWENKNKQNFIKLNCNHEFCKDCIINCIKNDIRNKPCCAICRTTIEELEIKDENFRNEFYEIIV
jgi:hypothetical protein